MAYLISILFCFILLTNLSSANVYSRSIARADGRTFDVLRPIRPRYIRDRIVHTSRSLVKSLRRYPQCAVSVCYSMEDSRYISRNRFLLQKQLVNLITAIISADNVATFGAVEYEQNTHAITPPTKKYYKFINKLWRAPRSGRGSVNLGAGMGYCGFRVQRERRKRGVVVIIGSGRSTTGFNPKLIARVLRRRSKVIFVSTEGRTETFQKTLGIRTRDVIVVRSVNDFDNAIRKIVPMICGK